MINIMINMMINIDLEMFKIFIIIYKQKLFKICRYKF